jgi:glycosyltransferase involved in cell wall biosynthesis
MKVLHLETGTHLYGGALQVLLLVEGLEARGVENLLVVPTGSDVEAQARKQGLPCRSVRMAGDADIFFLPRFRRLIRATKPDLVHLHSRRGADTLGAAGARWAGVPVVLTRRVDNLEPPVGVEAKYRLYDHVITISRVIRKVLIQQGVSPEKVRCVPSALDPGPYQGPCDPNSFRQKLGLPPRGQVVGMAAQFIPRKGHDILLQAVPDILEDHPETIFVLFGRGPLQEKMGQEVAPAGLSGSVYLPGFREDLPALLPCLDLLVHPATMEGLGVILLQAGAAGLPVVAAAAGGIPEVVVHGETGLLVRPSDPGSLAAAVISLLSDPPLAQAMGEAARERVEGVFSVDRMVEGNLAVYHEVLGESKKHTS